MRRLALLPALVLWHLCPAPGLAQAALQPKDRIRILTVDDVSLTGVLTELSPDSLMVTGVHGTRWVHHAEIAYLERSTGRYRQFGRNLILTTGSVAAISGMLGAITWKKCVSNEFLGCLFAPESRADAFMLGAIAGGVLSIPVGVIVGLAVQYDRWEGVRTDGSKWSRLSVAPLPGRGLGATASFTF